MGSARIKLKVVSRIGIEPITQLAYLWSSSFDISKQEKTLKKITGTIDRVQTSSTYVVNDQTLSDLVTKLQKFQSQVVKGYASSVYFAARAI